jgi:hypothetical protein
VWSISPALRVLRAAAERSKSLTLVDTGQSFTANLRAQEMPGLE